MIKLNDVQLGSVTVMNMRICSEAALHREALISVQCCPTCTTQRTQRRAMGAEAMEAFHDLVGQNPRPPGAGAGSSSNVAARVLVPVAADTDASDACQVMFQHAQ